MDSFGVLDRISHIEARTSSREKFLFLKSLARLASAKNRDLIVVDRRKNTFVPQTNIDRHKLTCDRNLNPSYDLVGDLRSVNVINDLARLELALIDPQANTSEMRYECRTDHLRTLLRTALFG